MLVSFSSARTDVTNASNLSAITPSSRPPVEAMGTHDGDASLISAVYRAASHASSSIMPVGKGASGPVSVIAATGYAQ